MTTTAAAVSGASVEFRQLRVRYANTERDAVRDINLHVPPSSFTVFVGPSGCGKSTLLRTVNRLVTPTSGSVLIDGTDSATLEPTKLRRSIGYAIQAVGLFPHMTVAQNIAVVPELLKWDRERIAARITELLELVKLDPQLYRDRYPHELSGGEAQRIGVARAIAAQPRILLMDEPFGAVDAIVRSSLQDEVHRIVRTLRTTVLFVTHDVDEALRLADRIVVMRTGKVLANGTPRELLESTHLDEYVQQLLVPDAATRSYRLSRLT